MLEDYDDERKPDSQIEPRERPTPKASSSSPARVLRITAHLDYHGRSILTILRPGQTEPEVVAHRDLLNRPPRSSEDRAVLKEAGRQVEKLGDELRRTGRLPPLEGGQKPNHLDPIRERQEPWLWTLGLMTKRPILATLVLPGVDMSEDRRVDLAPLMKWLPPGVGRRPFGPLKSMTTEEFEVIASGPYAARTILSNEVILDFDIRDAATLRTHLDHAKAVLDGWGWTYYDLPTGGKGHHLHFFLDPEVTVPERIAEKIERYNALHPKGPYDLWRFIRLYFFNRMVEEGELPVLSSGKEGMDPAPVGWSANGKGALIRMAGCIRDNGRTKTLDPTGQRLIIPIYQPKLNHWTAFQDEIFEQMGEDLDKKVNRSIPAAISGTSPVSVGCIAGMVETGGAEGMRHEDALRLATLMREVKMPLEQAEALMDSVLRPL